MDSGPIKFIFSTLGHYMLSVYTEGVSVVSLIFIYFYDMYLKVLLIGKIKLLWTQQRQLVASHPFPFCISNATCGLHLSSLPVSETFILLYLCNNLGLFPLFSQLWLVSCFLLGSKPCSHHQSPSNFSSYKNPQCTSPLLQIYILFWQIFTQFHACPIYNTIKVSEIYPYFFKFYRE